MKSINDFSERLNEITEDGGEGGGLYKRSATDGEYYRLYSVCLVLLYLCHYGNHIEYF